MNIILARSNITLKQLNRTQCLSQVTNASARQSKRDLVCLFHFNSLCYISESKQYLCRSMADSSSSFNRNVATTFNSLQLVSVEGLQS